MGKCLVILLALVLVSSSFALSGAAWASTSQPSVPEFTLKIVARPFDVAPSATVDPYTGQTIVTNNGYHVQNVSVDVTIKNQPSITHFQIQLKGKYQDNWQFYSDTNMITPIQAGYYFTQSPGEYTVISVPISSDDPLDSNGRQVGTVTNFPTGGEVEFQVRALNGHTYIKQSGLSGDMLYFDGETSDWSNTQTITINQTPDASLPDQSLSPSETQNPTSQPRPPITIQLGLDWSSLATVALLAVIAVLLAVTIVLLVMRQRSKLHSSPTRPN